MEEGGGGGESNREEKNDLVIERFSLGLVKGQAATEHRVETDAEAPQVDARAAVPLGGGGGGVPSEDPVTWRGKGVCGMCGIWAGRGRLVCVRLVCDLPSRGAMGSVRDLCVRERLVCVRETCV